MDKKIINTENEAIKNLLNCDISDHLIFRTMRYQLLEEILSLCKYKAEKELRCNYHYTIKTFTTHYYLKFNFFEDYDE